MKILDAGDHPLSNADVLAWIKTKRAQHASEDAEDKLRAKENSKTQYKPSPRPKNFLAALTRTERELSHPQKYPYAENLGVYGEERVKDFRGFALEVEEVIMDELEAGWRERDGVSEEVMQKEQEMKCLTEMELLMVWNLAPSVVEMLVPCVEGCEERFTVEEQGMIVDVINKRLRGVEPEEKMQEG